MTRVVRAEVTEEPITVEEVAALVGDPAAGAVATFAGIVRDHDRGRGVTGIGYTAHPTATDVVRAVAEEVATRPGLREPLRPGLTGPLVKEVHLGILQFGV